MYWQYQLRKIILGFLGFFSAANIALAQESSQEFWPEIDIWLRVSPSWRFSSYIPLSKNIETNYREGSLVLQADYAWGKVGRFWRTRLLDENRAESLKSNMARCGYFTGRSLADNGGTYSENTIYAEFHLRTPLKRQFLISHRFRNDFRWLGSENEFSARLRYRLMVEKELNAKKVSFVPYFSAEPYYDSRYSTINRVRLIGGTSVVWSPRYALEGNFTYQHDTRSSVTDLYALNLILHLYFETGKTKSNQSNKDPVGKSIQ